TEAARSVLFFTARELENADRGDEASKKRVRLLTPLLKFRACRDSRKVSADAMEVRGGCGYIEDWSDARLLRDAHLGSIWEGTSNIVALDVLRAIRKEQALDAFPDLGKAADLARKADDSHARQAATGLYYAVAAFVLKHEASQLGDRRRALIAGLIEKHRLSPRDPLEPSEDQYHALLSEEPIPN
ncbi:MAG: acyl-CoA dehydrogenase family protein, partial [Betaproteobacteria bacterium]